MKQTKIDIYVPKLTLEQTRSPLVAQQQPTYQLRTAQSNGEKGREQERVATTSTASTVKGPLLQPSFDKTAWP